MDKNRKLRRYSRKDYSQLVDFPVEIVGRDGVVRRYSFEESVRLYQRRIASADNRYDDGDIAAAEQLHCKRRIEQLRRSYFARYGWSAIQAAEEGIGEFAGEVAAFLRRYLDGSEMEPENLALTAIDENEDRQLYFASPREPGSDKRFLLYVYRFTVDNDAARAREEFFSFLKALQTVRGTNSSVEGLVAFHHSADCGLILTSPGGDGVQLQPTEPLHAHSAAPLAAPDPLREGIALLRQGERRAALRRFVRAYESNHYRKAAYISAFAVADHLGAHPEAETAALMGSRYFADDDELLFLLAISHVRRGDGQAAKKSLEQISANGPNRFDRKLIAALVELMDNNVRGGRRLLLAAVEDCSDPDPRLLATQRLIRAQLMARNALQVGVGLLAVVSIIAAVMSNPWFLIVTGLSIMVVPAVQTAWKRQLMRSLSTTGHNAVSLVDPAVLRDALRN
ncbi:MAG: hypothetical protein AAFV53_32245 [Myxococcota bacterium]